MIRPGTPADAAARERLLDFALEELGRAARGEEAPDLGARVRAAWEAGARGSDLAGIEPAADDTAGDPLHHRSPGPRPAAGAAGPRALPAHPAWRRTAAAALLLVAGALALRLAFPPVPGAPGEGASKGPGEGGGAGPVASATGAGAAALAPGRTGPVLAALESLLTPPLPSLPPLFRDALENERRTELLDLVGDDPAAWAFLERESLRRIGAREVLRPMVARLVGLALAGPPERGTPFARALWMAAPWAFGDQELVALADRGAFEAQRELVARTADALADPGAWPVPPVLAAAWLAERGDPRGRRLLARIVAGSDDPPGDLDAVDRLALAGRLLDDLGDARAWSRAHARVARAVEDWIGAGYLPRAASAAAILAFDARVPAAPRLPLADHAAALYRDRVQRVDALTGPDAIRALVASVARLR